MAEITTDDLQAALEAERMSLRQQLAELGHGRLGEQSGELIYDSNFADSSQVSAERGEHETLAASLMETLGEVERALAKFGTSSYGVCEQCGQPIALARLEAKPAARHCIVCAAKRR